LPPLGASTRRRALQATHAPAAEQPAEFFERASPTGTS